MGGTERRSRRIQTFFEAVCSSGREEGSGTLVDLSACGARLEDTTIRPPLGARVRAHVFLAEEDGHVELVGKIVRHTAKGFAIDYEKPHFEVVRMIKEALGPP